MKKKKILFVAPHPDDEALGCGGTILKHKNDGDEVYWLIVTNIDTANGWPEERVKSRQLEIEEVAQEFGFKETIKLDFPTTKLDSVPVSDMVDAISKVMSRIQPETIYLPNRSDVHTDHHVVFQSAWSCTKNFRYSFIKKVLMYEVLSETEFAPALVETGFIPNVFVDITNYIDKKIEIIKIYDSELMPAPLPRSINTIRAQGTYRGSAISADYAEAFMLLKEIC